MIGGMFDLPYWYKCAAKVVVTLLVLLLLAAALIESHAYFGPADPGASATTTDNPPAKGAHK